MSTNHKSKKHIAKDNLECLIRCTEGTTLQNLFTHKLWSLIATDGSDEQIVQDIFNTTCGKVFALPNETREKFLYFLIGKGANAKSTKAQMEALKNPFYQDTIFILNYLIENGATLVLDELLLELSPYWRWQEVTRYLLEKGAKPSRAFMFTICRYDCFVDIIKNVLKARPSYVNWKDSSGKTLLEVAWDYYRPYNFACLLEFGAFHSHLREREFYDPLTNQRISSHWKTANGAHPCCFCRSIHRPHLYDFKDGVHLAVCFKCAHNRPRRPGTTNIQRAFHQHQSKDLLRDFFGTTISVTIMELADYFCPWYNMQS